VNDLHCLLYAALLTWIMLVTASLLRSRGWTPAGLKTALGNRDDLGEPTPLVGRADRAAKNMLENLLLFVCVLVAARLANAPASAIDLGAQIFFFARVAYFVVYLAGIPYLRTAIWGVSLVGLAIIVKAAI
jgi:uncharacterized MAPEG superfamily protein